MKTVYFNYFPNWKTKAVTFSFDDGKLFDITLADIFAKYGAKCTFNLNYVNVGKEKYTDRSFIKELSKTHEIACHALTHPFLERLPDDQLRREIMDDKRGMEDIIGLPVSGFAYPYGTYDERVKSVLKSAGFLYSRTTVATNYFGYPKDYLEWHPTCHQTKAFPLIEKFFNDYAPLDAMYIWGHSYEFENKWNEMEAILGELAKSDVVWYCTNIELYDYKKAIENLRISSDGTSIFNPSATTVYAVADGNKIEIKPGLNLL